MRVCACGDAAPWKQLCTRFPVASFCVGALGPRSGQDIVSRSRMEEEHDLMFVFYIKTFSDLDASGICFQSLTGNTTLLSKRLN